MSLLLSCREVADLLSDYTEAGLPAPLRMRIRLHLSLCRACAVLHATLGATPGICREILTDPPLETPDAARRALALAQARLGEIRPPRPPAVDACPGELGRCTDRPLQVLCLIRDALAAGACPVEAPFLPEAALALVPCPSDWSWDHHPHAQSTQICTDGEARLLLLHAGPGYQQPLHTHHGSESILVLDGHLEDGDGLFTRGRWIHHPDGTTHAPAALGRGCWCLIREVGVARTRGLLHRGRNPLAA